MNLLPNYANIAVPDLLTHNFNNIRYYHDSIHYHDVLLYYGDSGKIQLLLSPITYYRL